MCEIIYAHFKKRILNVNSLSRCELIVNLCCQENKYGKENTDSVKVPGEER